MNKKQGQAVPIAILVVMLLLGGGFVATKTIGNKSAENTEKAPSGPTFPSSEDFVDDYDASIDGREGRTYVNTDVYENIKLDTEEDFFNPKDEYVPEVVYDNTAPALSDVEIDDGTAETNRALDERIELKEEVPESQALPQPVEETVAETEAKVEEEIRTVSKYLGLITMNASAAKKDEPDDERIILSAKSGNDSSINITGWKFRSAVTGRTIVIGKSERLFISGSAGAKENIVLAPKAKVTFISGRSPIGSDFVVNKCSGYLTQFQDFSPSVSKKCPEPEDEIVFYEKDPSIFIDNQCMDYVERIKKCTIVDEPFPAEITPMCQEAIVENLGYNICVNRHRNEEDFWMLDQRVYLKQGSDIWRDDREVIELIDEEGFVVDFHDY